MKMGMPAHTSADALWAFGLATAGGVPLNVKETRQQNPSLLKTRPL
jgi:hypothetical protein